MHRLDEALSDFTQAIALAPNWAAPYFNRGNIYLDRHDNSRAIADYDAAIERDADLAYAYLNRGIALEASGDIERCRTDYEHALLLDPTMQKARERLARIAPSPASALTPNTVAD